LVIVRAIRKRCAFFDEGIAHWAVRDVKVTSFKFRRRGLRARFLRSLRRDRDDAGELQLE
jgi:hypothetical protein